MARHAFISHSHRDAEAAEQILRALEQRGVKCWTAPRDVPPGGSYAEAILTAIENASCFVLVYTEHSNVSPHVLREVERALSLGINIMPVRFDSSAVSKSLDYLLATVHWLSVIAEPRAASVDQAAERIAACVTNKGDAPPVLREVPPPAMPAPRPQSARSQSPAPAPAGRGALLLWIGLALLAIAGVIFAVQTVRRSLPGENATTTADVPAATPAPTSGSVAAEIPTATPPPTTAAAEATVPPARETPAAEESPLPEETPTATETETEWRPPARNLPQGTPLDVVKRYFAYLSDRNTIKAYELLSTHYRTRENFVTYTRKFAATESLHFVNARQISTGSNTATVSVTFDKKNQKFGWIRWQGPIQLTAEASGWRIDSLKGLKASSIRR